MSDWQKAVNFLSEHGYEFIWKSPDGYETVWRKGNVDVSLDEISEKADITVPLSDLPSILSSLTLEDVERACEAAFKALPSTTDPSHFAAIRAYWLDVMDRLRQQVNGDTCNREGGWA